jgi:hypothetical protein
MLVCELPSARRRGLFDRLAAKWGFDSDEIAITLSDMTIHVKLKISALLATTALYFLSLPWLYSGGSGRFSGVARDARVRRRAHCGEAQCRNGLATLTRTIEYAGAGLVLF